MGQILLNASWLYREAYKLSYIILPKKYFPTDNNKYEGLFINTSSKARD